MPFTEARHNFMHGVDGNQSHASLSYRHDELNRITNVVDLATSTTNAYDFDGVGSLQTVRYHNGVTNRYAYDALNRLTNLISGTPSVLLASFAYRLAPAGNRTNLAETINGLSRTNQWQYDPLYRLTNEIISGSAPTGTISYRYDAVGNRTNRTSTVAGITNQTPTYNSSDLLRCLAEAGLKVVEQRDQVGQFHTWLKCKRA